jgi:hypothetical protein
MLIPKMITFDLSNNPFRHPNVFPKCGDMYIPRPVTKGHEPQPCSFIFTVDNIKGFLGHDDFYIV